MLNYLYISLKFILVFEIFEKSFLFQFEPEWKRNDSVMDFLQEPIIVNGVRHFATTNQSLEFLCLYFMNCIIVDKVIAIKFRNKICRSDWLLKDKDPL